MVNRLRHILVWFCRIRHSRGFGVQSPWAYRFVRYVINEHYPYYAYSDLEVRHPHSDTVTNKLSRLYFRIANYRQVDRWGFAIDRFDVKAEYVQCGCNKAEIVDCINGYELELIQLCNVLVMTLESNWTVIFNAFANHAQSDSILIVEDIHATRTAKRAWKQMRDDERTGISFDLYYCGIIFFDRSMYKQSYKVNF